MKTIALTLAVIQEILSFGTDTFSIYNVTKNIREHVNCGDYVVEHLGTNISHDDVKNVFSQLLETGVLLNNYSVSNHPDGYRQFTLTESVDPIFKKFDDLEDGTVDDIFDYYGEDDGDSSNFEEEDWFMVLNSDEKKIVRYVYNHPYCTVKQIHSALKSSDWTCSDIWDFLNDFGMLDENSVDDEIPVSMRLALF